MEKKSNQIWKFDLREQLISVMGSPQSNEKLSSNLSQSPDLMQRKFERLKLS